MKRYIKKVLLAFSIIFCSLFYAYIPVSAEESIPAEVPAPQVNILIRNMNNVIYEGSIDLPVSGTIDVLDHSAGTHTVNADSVLGVLYALDSGNDSFSISDLEYYSAFSSFYLKCITGSTGGSCDNWQYVVNGVTPGSGMDNAILFGGENIGIYFGNSHRLTVPNTNTTTDTPVSLSAEKYNYLDNSWNALTGVTIGATVPNPSDEWNPTVVKEVAVDSLGKADVALTEPGTYTFGIKEDYYFPNYQVIITTPVVAPPVTTPSSGGHGGEDTIFIQKPVHHILDVHKAVSFLKTIEDKNGFYKNDMLTDWVAIGLAKVPNIDISNLKKYISLNDLPEKLALTDYERRAIALEALGIDPAIGTEKNYIQKIIDSFDGAQFGDKNLYNDDIFAIIPLLHAGYTKDDEVIKKSVDFIISKQHTDGSWNGVDITSAAVQALSQMKDLSGVTESITKARQYLVSSQKSDGGFGSSFSTSWALGAIKSLGGLPETWVQNDLNPNDYLYSVQFTDGGVEDLTKDLNTRIFATAYAIPSAIGLDWNTILGTYKKYEIEKIVPSVKEKINIKSSELAVSPVVNVITGTKENTLVASVGDIRLNKQDKKILMIIAFCGVFLGVFIFKWLKFKKQ